MILLLICVRVFIFLFIFIQYHGHPNFLLCFDKKEIKWNANIILLFANTNTKDQDFTLMLLVSI